MIRDNTPVERHDWLLVKREDLASGPPGPPFSKMRGVIAHLRKRPERSVGVLDTYHSQAGHAVAAASALLGKSCVNYYPEYKHEPGPRLPQERARELGATLHPLSAGRSAVLFHRARAHCVGYMMPNALKLDESVDETEQEARRTQATIPDDPRLIIVIPSSSATIASGVARAYTQARKIVHLGYSRNPESVLRYMRSRGVEVVRNVDVIDEGYAYKDRARRGPTPPWPCNAYYDLKAYRWLMANAVTFTGREVMLWNVG